MAENSNTQMVLARQADFIDRIEYNLLKQAVVVAAEAEDTPNHEQRRRFAYKALESPDAWAANVAKTMVSQISVLGAGGANITVGEGGKVSCAATDADLFAGIASVWNAFSGV